MKSKYLLIAGIVILLILGGAFFLSSQTKKPSLAPVPVAQEETIQTLKPEDLGLTFTARSDNRAVKILISKSDDISSIEYEINYTAKGDIPRGAIGEVTVKPSDTKIETNYIDLGTCSSGKCKYDEVTSPVKLLLKITKKDGKVFQSEKTLDLTAE